MAAKILKVGKHRVWVDPTKIKEVESAVTKADIRRIIKKGYIKVLPEKIKKEKERKKRKGAGRRKGKKFAVFSKKERWILTVRALRKNLKEMKDEGKIDKRTYRKLYLMVKSGTFRSRSHLKTYLKQHGLIKE